jgi:sigma-B regulation protein RsbU (phosphoserine phosphatase)
MSEPPAKKRTRRTTPEPAPVPDKPAAGKRATATPAPGAKPSRRGTKAEAPPPDGAPEPPVAPAAPEPGDSSTDTSAPSQGAPLASISEGMPDPFSERRPREESPQGALKNGDGKTSGLSGTSRDMPRHQPLDNEQALQSEQLRLALSAAQMGLWDWDLQAGRIRWSENIDSILGGVPGGPGDTYEAFLQRVLAEDQTRLAQKVAAALQSPQDFEAEFRVYVPAGAPRWMRAKVRVLSENGQARRMLGTLKDITREQQVEEESRRAADFQEQLIDIVSHDIRSPLGAIISWARIMALGGPPPEEQQRTFRRITSAALRIERLTRLLLDFARARLGGGITLEPRRCDLHELLQKVSHEFRIAYPDRTVQSDQEGEPTGGTWDPDRLAQVVSNLVENALKYSPPDTLVRLTAKGQKEQVVLEVHNQGKPIPPELMPHIFEPFRRGPQSSRTAKTSYGLGLYIVQEIVLAHGGTIDVRSDIEEGTTFTVKLPRVPPAALDMMRRPSPASPKGG